MSVVAAVEPDDGAGRRRVVERRAGLQRRRRAGAHHPAGSRPHHGPIRRGGGGFHRHALEDRARPHGAQHRHSQPARPCRERAHHRAVPRPRRGARRGHRARRRGAGDHPFRQRQGTQLPGSGCAARPERQIEPLLVTLSTPHEVFPLYQHPGVELLYVLEGSIGVRLRPRTATCWNPATPCSSRERWRTRPTALVDLPVRFLSLKVYPSPPADRMIRPQVTDGR